jgi:hypothetical protein
MALPAQRRMRLETKIVSWAGALAEPFLSCGLHPELRIMLGVRCAFVGSTTHNAARSAAARQSSGAGHDRFEKAQPLCSPFSEDPEPRPTKIDGLLQPWYNAPQRPSLTLAHFDLGMSGIIHNQHESAARGWPNLFHPAQVHQR